MTTPPQYGYQQQPYEQPQGYPPPGYPQPPEYARNYPQQTYPPAPTHHGAPPRRRKRRVFLWIFLAIQVLFIIWIVTGIATVHTGPTHAQLVSGCYNHAWFPLFKSQADCVKHYGGALNDAGTAGKAIGVGLIIAFWFVVDMILGVSYGVYKLATRNR
jgi:hypothetical protein